MTGKTEKDRRSRFTGQISTGDILTFLGMAIGITSFYFALSGDVRVVKVQVDNLKESIQTIRTDVIAWEKDVNQQIRELLIREHDKDDNR